MKFSPSLRNWPALVLAALCLVSTPLAADEILHNSDFSKGADNWSGDLTADANDNPLQPATTNQVTLNLRDRRPVRIFQAFNAAGEHVTCTVSFTLSTGGSYTGTGKVSDVASDVREGEIKGTSYNASNNTVTAYINPNYATFDTPFSSPVLILANADDNLVSLYPLGMVAGAAPTGNGTAPAVAATDPAGTSFTVTANVKPHRSYRLYLAFPPGTGSVTVTKISLSNDAK